MLWTAENRIRLATKTGQSGSMMRTLNHWSHDPLPSYEVIPSLSGPNLCSRLCSTIYFPLIQYWLISQFSKMRCDSSSVCCLLSVVPLCVPSAGLFTSRCASEVCPSQQLLMAIGSKLPWASRYNPQVVSMPMAIPPDSDLRVVLGTLKN